MGGVIVVHKCFGSGISVSGELVPDINNFEKLKVFEFLNLVGSHQKEIRN